MADKEDLKCDGFALQRHHCCPEEKALSFYALKHDIPFKWLQLPSQVPDGWVPCGTLKWMTACIGRTVLPNYFPGFMGRFVTRKVWREDKWPLRKVFIKPADEHKRFDGFVAHGTYSKKKRGPFWCSEIVSFVDEWRYYVANGKLLGAHWYTGKGADLPQPPVAPAIDVEYPQGWCGTVDLGTLPDGRAELVEAHPPFSVGWYGSDEEEFARFTVAGWRWLMERRDMGEEA